jgi:hypothetical protein
LPLVFLVEIMQQIILERVVIVRVIASVLLVITVVVGFFFLETTVKSVSRAARAALKSLIVR